MIVRDATVADVGAITSIYNATVPTTTVAWTEVLQTVEDRAAWFERQQEQGHASLVAEVDGEVVGFAAYADFRDSVKWPGYRFTVEHTVHVTEARRGNAIGRSLMIELIERARAAGKHVMVGGIDGANEGSLRFHARLGFTEVARMPEVGFKFGRWLDLVLVQRRLDDQGR